MPANDEPHGVFSLSAGQQAIAVLRSGSEVTRALVMNVTRLAGLFGNISVGYRIIGGIENMMDVEEIFGGKEEGTLFFREGQTFGTITVPISSQVRRSMLVQVLSKLGIENKKKKYYSLCLVLSTHIL